jgi:hypothetical protein
MVILMIIKIQKMMQGNMKELIAYFFTCFVLSASALEPMEDKIMGDYSAQGGVYLSGDVTINEIGGPLNEVGDGNPSDWVNETCSTSLEVECGARLAFRTGSNQGWLILDNIRGGFSFEGLTLQTRLINSGFDNGNPADSDGEVFDQDVLEIGLPNTVKYDNVTFALATSNQARITDSGAVQTNIFDVRINGDVTMQGNLLIFPTGNP